jgi:putative radical SAM enzyme (TIGR03279 family)
MGAIVSNIEPNSIAEELEIMPGDEVLAIDNVKPRDIIDYNFLTAGEEISLHIKRTSGEEEIIDIEKDPEEELGIIFESAVFDRIIPCTNRCIFCFVDQQPPEMRESLYIKDDDYRLSYLQGTYITLTNLKPEHRKRIEESRLGPLYVSVHTTNPDLRCRMLGNPNAGDILKELKWLNKLDIPVHAQIVLCPGINDGKELERTLNDLKKLKSNIMSVAIVPVGLTKYRQDDLKPFTQTLALEVINQIEEFNKGVGYSLAVPSDELYLKARLEIPKDGFYRGYGQLEDGVGTARMLLDDFKRRKKRLPKALSKPLKLAIATGQLACDIMQPIIKDLNKIENLSVELIPVKSEFWGDKVTVSGLITGKDLIEAGKSLKDKPDNLIIPSVMLRKGSDRFLDDITLDDIKKKLKLNIHVIENYYSTEELVNIIVS